jgi:hypothetical protein
MEYETTTPAGERILHRFHCGNKLFYIFSAGYKGKRPADLDRIINSFHVVNPVSASHPLDWGQGHTQFA